MFGKTHLALVFVCASNISGTAEWICANFAGTKKNCSQAASHVTNVSQYLGNR